MGQAGTSRQKRREHYASERKGGREVREIPDEEREEVAQVFRGYGLTSEQIRPSSRLSAIARKTG